MSQWPDRRSGQSPKSAPVSDRAPSRTFGSRRPAPRRREGLWSRRANAASRPARPARSGQTSRSALLAGRAPHGPWAVAAHVSRGHPPRPALAIQQFRQVLDLHDRLRLSLKEILQTVYAGFTLREPAVRRSGGQVVSCLSLTVSDCNGSDSRARMTLWVRKPAGVPGVESVLLLPGHRRRRSAGHAGSTGSWPGCTRTPASS